MALFFAMLNKQNGQFISDCFILIYFQKTALLKIIE